MKVLHININYLTTALHQTMIERLDALGVENVVFAPTHQKKAAVIKPNDHVIVSECFRKLDRVNFFYKQHKILKALLASVDPGEFDAVHAYTLYSDGNVALSLKKKYGTPYVVAVRNTDVNSFMKYRPYLLPRGIEIMKNADRVFFLSPAYREKVLDLIRRSADYENIREKCEVVPNGIDDFWHEHPRTEALSRETLARIAGHDIKLLCVGQIIPGKNIPALQKAVGLLNNEGFRISLTVIGKAVDQALLAEIKSDPYTTYIPAMPKEELIHHLREADIFALVSTSETFGLVYAESLSQGLPVVYTRNEGFDGQFEEGYIGYSALSSDVSSIAEAIRRAVENYEELRIRAVPAAERFNWADICGRYKDTYSSMQK